MNTLTVVLALLLSIVAVSLVLIAAFLWSLVNAKRIRRKLNIDLDPIHARIVDFVSRKIPALFWKRNHRVTWLKGVTWHEFPQ
ncbi:MAG: hypothetical protein QF921_05030 [Pseudomonadales bacterium]|jgi:hypothetical protein|nr:hypothetical protein [Pseudomonadales bacterium]MDP6471874.1 hypothetical protein [Pseudomonadales bacterium]MDP6826856.1 hypothetical protein [Pseudomonadales bacterium]MDP6970866.1 hypothetical protein [Pseudomonadales bacterium]|tara:strand:+ start:217 stop:465 length:249 start_codon:yes stop_codon:yes gene_type:complete